MKKTTGALALITLILSQALVAAVASTAATRVTTTTTFGRAVSTEIIHEEGCLRTRFELFANINAVKGSSVADNFGIVAVSRVNTCTNLSEIEGFGQTTDFKLIVDKDLSTATMRISLPVSNILNGTSAPLSAELRIKASAATVKTVEREEVLAGNVLVKSKFAVSARDAVATGTVILGSEVIVGPDDASRVASIFRAKVVEKTKAVRP